MKVGQLGIATLLFLLFSLKINAQPPAPAPAQAKPLLIVGATAHLGNGQIIANSAIAFENGKITLVADAASIRLDRTKFAKIFDATGKHVYPGFIAPNTRLGLVEVEAARPTQDYAEVGSLNPNARSLVAYNTDSDIQPTVRANGVLMAQVVPVGGLLSGTSSIVQLDAWNWEDAAFRTDDGVHLNWPALQTFSGDGPRKNDQYAEATNTLERFFAEAKAYCAAPNPAARNLRFEAMRGVLEGKQTLFVHADAARAIQDGLLFAKKHGCKAVLVGGNDAWLLLDFLKTNNVPVLLGETQRLPAREDEAVDQPFKTAAALQKAGILFAFCSDGAWQQRNLPFQAGQAVGFGLEREAAVSALTLNSAKILGIESRAGSLETGKDATLFISEGDALDMRSCIVTAAFIQGREISLDNKQKQLHRRFSN